jgi:hypothetical protein
VHVQAVYLLHHGSVTRVHPQLDAPAQQLAIRQQHGTSAAFPAIAVAANTAKIQFQVQIVFFVCAFRLQSYKCATACCDRVDFSAMQNYHIVQ